MADKEKKERENEEVEILDDILENIPPEHRKSVEKMIISSSVQMRGIISPESHVMNRITSEHISDFLRVSEQEMRLGYQDEKQKRIITLVTVIFAMIFFIAIIILLKATPDVMEKIIYAAGGLVAGAFGGYGYGKHKRES